MSSKYTCKLDPETNTTLEVYLFKNVVNLKEIRKNIIEGAWNCAVIKPAFIVDPFQIAVAANRAMVSQKFNTMVTKTVFGEIIYNLSLTKNISQSLNKFGIGTDREILISFLVKSADSEKHREEVLSQIQGELSPIGELTNITNLEDCQKTYKLSKGNVKCKDDLLNSIVSKMVTKNFISH